MLFAEAIVQDTISVKFSGIIVYSVEIRLKHTHAI